jgi:DNA (cytosine-5)-methyltransferase 1
MLTAGSLFAGYGGIELALSSVLDVRPAWFVEFDKAPSKVLTHHWPDVPNYGDVTTVDWSTVPPVDIITGGSPCQDLSHAGKRAGMTEGTRSNLWVQMREAINVIRPRLVVWENVRGAFSAPADSALEPCPRCVGDGDNGPVLRALGRVLGDLADLGYDCRWYGLRAADVGAAHGRFRVFLFAVPADSDDQGLQGLADQARTASTGRHGHPVAGVGGSALTLLPTPKASNNENRSSGWANGPNLGEALALLPTPRATDGTKGGPNQRGSSGDLMLPSAVTLLPTPAVNDMGAGKTVDEWDAWTDRMKTAHGNGNGHGKSLSIEAARLLPTPSVADGMGGHLTRSGARSNELLLPGVAKAHQQAWGQYAAAIARAEQAIGRPAPPPTETGPKGAARLSPRFVEFLMMLPEGWVTDVAGLSRNDQLKMLGNGVVPAQCAAALRAFLWDAYGIGAAA